MDWERVPPTGTTPKSPLIPTLITAHLPQVVVGGVGVGGGIRITIKDIKGFQDQEGVEEEGEGVMGGEAMVDRVRISLTLVVVEGQEEGLIEINQGEEGIMGGEVGVVGVDLDPQLAGHPRFTPPSIYPPVTLLVVVGVGVGLGQWVDHNHNLIFLIINKRVEEEEEGEGEGLDMS